MPQYRPLQTAELSQNDRENSRWGVGQYLLGGLALFGVARALPRLIAESPKLRQYFAEELTNLATKVTPDKAERFFAGINLYTGTFSGQFSNRGFEERMRLLKNEAGNLRKAFQLVDQNWNTAEHRAPYFMEDAVGSFNRMIHAVRRVHDNRDTADAIFKEWHQAVVAESSRRVKSSSMEELTGMRHLTVGEALSNHQHLFSTDTAAQLTSFAAASETHYGAGSIERFMNMPLDHRVFVGHSGNVVDMRGVMNSYERTKGYLATEWNVPFVKINPFTILGYNQYNTLKNESFSWVFPALSRGPALYQLERGQPAQGTEASVLGYVGGKMLEVTRAGEFKVSEGWHLTTPGSQFGQHIRRMQKIRAQDWDPKEGHPLLKFAEDWMLFQQELEGEDFEFFSVDSWFSTGINKLLKRVSPYTEKYSMEDVHVSLPQYADPIAGPDGTRREYRVAFRQSRFNMDEMNFRDLWQEITASPSRDPENVTTATMIGFTFAYKTNVALNQIGLGLPVEAMPSTVDFFKNLVNKRVLPAIALFYGWRALNEVTDDASPASAMAAGVKGWQDVVSGASDLLGLPERMKRLGSLMPGVDQIGEFPILPLPNNRGEISVLTLSDLLPVHMTPEELVDQRKYGMTAVRRGRFWSVGNMPFTGQDITSYVPHWSRITNVDGDYRYYGEGPQRGNLFPAASDLPLLGGALSALSERTGGGEGFGRGEPFFTSISGPMGTLRLQSLMGAGDGDGDGTSGFGSNGGLSGAPGRVFVPLANILRDPDNPTNPALAAFSSAGRQASDIFGFTGFAIRTASGLDFERHVGILSAGGIGNTLWHSQLGGFGGTISEVFRRFFPPVKVDDSYDRTPSGMPSWLPGDGSFTNFQRGYAYEKVPMGNYVLPGPQFAELWRMDRPDLSIEAGSLGSGADAFFEYKRTGTDDGDKIARQVSRQLMNESSPFAVHKGGRVVNAAHQVYTDVPFFVEGEGQAIPAFYASQGQEDAVRRRASFAAAQLGAQHALVFTGAGNGLQSETIVPDHNALANLMADAEQKRAELEASVRAGVSNGMELYHPAYRMLSLASAAPNSDEYRQAAKLVSGLNLTPELEKIVEVARDMAENNRKRLRVYPYQFLGRDMKNVTGIVEQVIDSERVLISGMPNPVRLAGLQALPGESSQQAEEYLRSVLQPGTEVSIGLGQGEAWKLNKEGQTVRAILHAGNLDLNRELLRMGLAVEDQDDTSVAAMQLRFTPGQRAFGAAWESFAHLSMPFHTKFLQVKSPTEAYEEREVFGKSFQSWDRPLDDYLEPTLQSFGRHGLVAGTLLGAGLGYSFGASPRGRLIFSAIGLAAGFATSLGISGSELFGKHWTPERRRKQWALEEYVDALEYVKSLRNFASLAKKAKSDEGFDVYSYLRKQDERGGKNRYNKDVLEAKKRKILEAGPYAHAQTLATELQIPGEYADVDELLKSVNSMLTGITNDRDYQPIGPIAAQALSWYQASKQTMQGWRPGDPIQDLIAALPSTDRKYFSELVDAQDEELRRLDAHAPRYLMRAIRMARGEAAPERASMAEIFNQHGLPGPDWEGWRPEVSLGDVRIKIVQREGMDEHGMGIYPQEIEAANRSGIKNIPRFGDYPVHPDADQIEQRIRGILGSGGIEYSIDISPGGDGLQVDLEHEQDRSGLISHLLRAGGIPLD